MAMHQVFLGNHKNDSIETFFSALKQLIPKENEVNELTRLLRIVLETFSKRCCLKYPLVPLTTRELSKKQVEVDPCIARIENMIRGINFNGLVNIEESKKQFENFTLFFRILEYIGFIKIKINNVEYFAINTKAKIGFNDRNYMKYVIYSLINQLLQQQNWFLDTINYCLHCSETITDFALQQDKVLKFCSPQLSQVAEICYFEQWSDLIEKIIFNVGIYIGMKRYSLLLNKEYWQCYNCNKMNLIVNTKQFEFKTCFNCEKGINPYYFAIKSGIDAISKSTSDRFSLYNHEFGIIEHRVPNIAKVKISQNKNCDKTRVLFSVLPESMNVGSIPIYEFVSYRPTYKHICEFISLTTSSMVEASFACHEYYLFEPRFRFLKFLTDKAVYEYKWHYMKDENDVITPCMATPTMTTYYEIIGNIDVHAVVFPMTALKYLKTFGPNPICANIDNCKWLKKTKTLNLENISNQQNILEHLMNFEHFDGDNVNRRREPCQCNEECKIFEKVRKNKINKFKNETFCDGKEMFEIDQSETICDKIHVLTMSHYNDDNDSKHCKDSNMKGSLVSSLNLRLKSDNDVGIKGNQPNDYQFLEPDNVMKLGTKLNNDVKQGRDKLLPHVLTVYAGMVATRDHALATAWNANAILLINEIIKNGFEEDLKPRFNANGYFEKYAENAFKFDCKTSIHQLTQLYGIFDDVIEKLNHPRHVEMARPLDRDISLMLALRLYTSANCNHDLSKSQRKGDLKKWETWHRQLNIAIRMLDGYEVHNEFIFCGLQKTQIGQSITKESIISLKTFHSFSRDITVATDFAGDDGMVIGFNVHNVNQMKHEDMFHMFICDLSWVSQFENEKENLVVSFSVLPLYPNKIYKCRSNNTIFVNCDPVADMQQVGFDKF